MQACRHAGMQCAGHSRPSCRLCRLFFHSIFPHFIFFISYFISYFVNGTAATRGSGRALQTVSLRCPSSRPACPPVVRLLSLLTRSSPAYARAHTHAHTHTRTYAHTHTGTHVRARAHTHTQVHACMYIWMDGCMHARAHTQPRAQNRSEKQVSEARQIQMAAAAQVSIFFFAAHTHTNTVLRMHAHKHTHKRTHARAHLGERGRGGATEGLV